MLVLSWTLVNAGRSDRSHINVQLSMLHGIMNAIGNGL